MITNHYSLLSGKIQTLAFKLFGNSTQKGAFLDLAFVLCFKGVRVIYNTVKYVCWQRKLSHFYWDPYQDFGYSLPLHIHQSCPMWFSERGRVPTLKCQLKFNNKHLTSFGRLTGVCASACGVQGLQIKPKSPIHTANLRILSNYGSTRWIFSYLTYL